MAQLHTHDEELRNLIKNAVIGIKFAAELSSLNIKGFSLEMLALASAKNNMDNFKDNVYKTMRETLKNKDPICVMENCGNCCEFPLSFAGEKYFCNGTGGVFMLNMENVLCILQIKAGGGHVHR